MDTAEVLDFKDSALAAADRVPVILITLADMRPEDVRAPLLFPLSSFVDAIKQ